MRAAKMYSRYVAVEIVVGGHLVLLAVPSPLDARKCGLSCSGFVRLREAVVPSPAIYTANRV
jgi:hypothetical protein